MSTSINSLPHLTTCNSWRHLGQRATWLMNSQFSYGWPINYEWQEITTNSYVLREMQQDTRTEEEKKKKLKNNDLEFWRKLWLKNALNVNLSSAYYSITLKFSRISSNQLLLKIHVCPWHEVTMNTWILT